MRTLAVLAFLVAVTSAQAETIYFRGYNFETYLIPNTAYGQTRFDGSWRGELRTITVREGQEYSIVVRNPLPVRVAVEVQVDGLNTIDGRSNNSAQGAKWLIGPYGTTTIRGWQTGSRDLRKFVFTRPDYSYAAWRERSDGRQYTNKLGEISIAYFWNAAELQRALYSSRSNVYEGDSLGSSLSRPRESNKQVLRGPAPYDDRAGTGMGRRDYNPVREVDFYYDSGMYSNSEVLRIYYQFEGRYQPRPMYEPPLRYAPEMP